MNKKILHTTRVLTLLATATLVACGGGSVETETNLNAVNPTQPDTQQPGTNGSDNTWRLMWSDEFDGASINSSNWSHEVNCLGGGNQERQCYTDDTANSFVSDGTLKIVAKLNEGAAGNDDDFTSARMITRNKVDFRYGRIEMRAKLPKGQGSWPAFWMMPTDSVYGTWPKSGEIDIMEAVNLGVTDAEGNEQKDIYGTLHYGRGPLSDFSGTNHTPATNPGDEFNVYALEWQEGEMRWYFNDTLYATQRMSELRVGGDGTVQGLDHRGWYAQRFDFDSQETEIDWSTAPFDQEFYLILNQAVGGTWPEGVNATGVDANAFAGEGQPFEIDYVRVYQCAVDSNTGRGCETTAPGYDVLEEDGGMLIEGLAPFPTLEAGAPNPIQIFNGETDTLNSNWIAWDDYADSNTVLVTDDSAEARGEVYQFTVDGVNDQIVFGFSTRRSHLPEDPSSPISSSPHNALGLLPEGYITFDLYVVTQPNSDAAEWFFKVESSGSQGGQDESFETLLTNYGDAPVAGQWTTYQIPLADLQADGRIDLSLIDLLMVFPTWGDSEGAQFRMDNVAILGGEVVGPVVEVVESVFSAGTTATDFDVWVDNGSATSTIITDEERGDVVQFDIVGSDGVVVGFNARDNSGAFNATDFAADGIMSFDMKVLSAPANTDAVWLVKLESGSQAQAYETQFAVNVEAAARSNDPDTYATPGEWQTYYINMADAVAAGLDPSAIDIIMVFPSWGQGQGASYQLDNVQFVRYDAVPEGVRGMADMQPFGGALREGDTFEVPTNSESWAGYANAAENDVIYPLAFPNGGQVTFTAMLPADAAPVDVRFRFENAPFPNVEPFFDAPTVTVTGSEAMTYTVVVPERPADQTYESFLMYVENRDAPITITNIVICEDPDVVCELSGNVVEGGAPIGGGSDGGDDGSDGGDDGDGGTDGGDTGGETPAPLVVNIGDDIIVDGSFDATEGSSWTAGTVMPEGENNVLVAQVSAAGDPWSVNVSQVLTLEPSTNYTLTFKAKASQARSIIAGIGQNASPFYSDTENVAITTEWETYTLEVASVDLTTGTIFGDENSRVLFDLGEEVGDVTLDDVTLSKSTQIVVDSAFDYDVAFWNAGSTVLEDEGTDAENRVYFAEVTAAGDPWSVNLSQVLTIEPGKTYQVTFKAKASQDRNIVAGIGLNADPFSSNTEIVPLTTEWQTFTYNLPAINDADGVPFGDANSRVLFDMGAEVGNVSIDDVTVQLLSGELLTNGNFEDGIENWTGGEVVAVDGNNYFTANVATAGNPWDVNLSQIITIEPASQYVLSFSAKGAAGRTMLAGIGLNSGSYNNSSVSLTLTDTWTTYTFILTSTDADGIDFGDDNSRVLFDMGGDVGEVSLDNVSLKPYSAFDQLVLNADFSADVEQWNGGATVLEGDNSVFQAEVTTAGDSWSVNLSQVLTLLPDTEYVFSFKAKASLERNIIAGLGQNASPFYATTNIVDLTTEWQTFTYTLRTIDIGTGNPYGDDNSRVLFDMGHAVGTVFIDDVQLLKSK